MIGAPSGYGVSLSELLARGAGRGLEGMMSGVGEEVFKELRGGSEKIQFRVIVSVFAFRLEYYGTD